jgi:hypothetical protein
VKPVAIVIVLAACSNPASPQDAGIDPDSREPDAAIDAGVDAPPACPAGTASCNAVVEDGCESTLPCPGIPLIPGRDQVRGLFVDDQLLHWADNTGPAPLPSSGIHTMTTTGGSPITLEPGLDLTGPIADATYVYWGNASGIRRRAKATGTPTTVVPLTAKPSWILGDANHIYWLSTGSTELWRASKQTWSPVRLETTEVTLSPPVLAPGALFWSVSSNPNIVIMRSDPSTPDTKTPFLTVQSERIVMLAIVGTDLIYAARDRGEIMKMPISGGVPTPLATNELSPLWLKCTPQWCYWVTNPQPGIREIRRVSLQGGSPETYANTDASHYFSSLAVDATHVYWSIALTGAISRAGH